MDEIHIYILLDVEVVFETYKTCTKLTINNEKKGYVLWPCQKMMPKLLVIKKTTFL